MYMNQFHIIKIIQFKAKAYLSSVGVKLKLSRRICMMSLCDIFTILFSFCMNHHMYRRLKMQSTYLRVVLVKRFFVDFPWSLEWQPWCFVCLFSSQVIIQRTNCIRSFFRPTLRKRFFFLISTSLSSNVHIENIYQIDIDFYLEEKDACTRRITLDNYVFYFIKSIDQWTTSLCFLFFPPLLQRKRWISRDTIVDDT